MSNLRLTLAAVLLVGASLPALAVDTKPVTNPDTASVHQATSVQTAMNTSSDTSISSDASSTQRKGMHLSAKQRAKADADEAETTRQLNQQAAKMAKPANG